MNRKQKSELVSSLNSKLSNSAFIAIAHYRGMSDKQLYDLRVAVKSKGCGMKIIKNNLAKIAIRGTNLELLTEHLSGPTALLYSQDPVALSKVMVDVAKQTEFLKIKIGLFNNLLINELAIKDMAKLGSIEEVRASFVGLLKATQSRFVQVVNAREKKLSNS